MSAPDDPTRIGNRYRLEQRIGAGAMGAVWLGTDDRVPLRFSFGPYQADLISGTPTTLK